MKKYAIAVFLIAMLLSANMTFAEESNDATTTAENSAKTKREEMLQKKQEWLKQKQEKAEELKKRRQEISEMKSKYREKMTEERCSRIQERIQNKTDRFDSNKEKHMTVYKNMKERISKFIEKLTAKGYDTTELKSDLTVLEGKIDQFSADYAAYIAKLKSTNTLACGHSEGEFRGGLVESKDLLKTVHQDAADIRTYVRTEIKADIQDLRKQKIEKEKSEKSAESENESDKNSETTETEESESSNQ